MKRRFAVIVLACGFVPLTSSGAQPTAEAGLAQHATLAVGMRIRAAEEDNAWPAYEASVHHALQATGTPRDLAFAALDLDTAGATLPANVHDEQLFRAAMAIPDDALVQWLIANRLLGSRDARTAAIVANVTRLEPDNAEAWGLALALASARNEHAGVDDALAHMAASTRSDPHLTDALHAWFEVYERNPPPRSLFVESADADSAVFVAAMARTAALALPAYQPLLLACKPSADVDLDAMRAADCATVGHLMTHHATSLIGRSIGFALLRNLGVATDEDKTARRNLDWLMQNIGDATDKNALAAQAHQADWVNLDNEYEIMQRALRRAGLPVEAPDGWQPHAAIAKADRVSVGS